MNHPHRVGFEKEERFLKALYIATAKHADFKASTLKEIIAEIAPDFLDGLFEDRPCVRQLKFIGNQNFDDPPDGTGPNPFFEIGKTYESATFNGGTYTFEGYERRIGAAYFEVLAERSAHEQLIKALSFVNCRTKADVIEHASMVAAELIQNWKIVSPRGSRRFLALEFYLWIHGVFEDDATHRHDDQLKTGSFYFHTKSRTETPPPIFNRHGVDITCGDKSREIYGGILLRHLGGEGNRDGSGLALRSLVRGDEGFKPIKKGSTLSKWSAEEINFFHKVRSQKSIFEGAMYLEHAPLDEHVEILKGQRIGIDGKMFASEPLRFFKA